MNETPSKPILVLGYGNRARGDDALGVAFVERLAELPAHLQDRIEGLSDHQLVIDHALDLLGRQRVLFVDASIECPAPYQMQPVLPNNHCSDFSHHLSPAALLQVYRQITGLAPPPSFALAIRGDCFEWQDALSPAGQHHLMAAFDFARDYFFTADLEEMLPADATTLQ